MSHGGKRAGAGRKPGVPAKMSSTRVERALAQGKSLPPEELLALAERAMVMVERYQPATEKHPNELADEERYAFWMDKAGEYLKAAAPYYAPRLHAIATEVTHEAEVSISQTLNVTMSPQEAMQEYIKLIDAKPL